MLTILIEIAGGLMIVLGLWTQVLAFLLFLFMIPVMTVFYNLWGAGDPAQAPQQMIHFLKNLAIMADLLHLYAFGPDHFSLKLGGSARGSLS